MDDDFYGNTYYRNRNIYVLRWFCGNIYWYLSKKAYLGGTVCSVPDIIIKQILW